MKTQVYLIVLIALAAQHAFPCSCITIGETGEDATATSTHPYEAVFLGEVVSVRWVHAVINISETRIVQAATFDVSRYWKGKVPPVVTVFSGVGAGDCGVPFEVGSSYLVFAEPPPAELRKPLNIKGGLWTDICTPTRGASSATEIRTWLDELPSATFETFADLPGITRTEPDSIEGE